MADNEKFQDQNEVEEKVEKEPQVTELDDENLEDVSGGATIDGFAGDNGNCVC
jgi:hypothetical protein